MVKYTSLLVPYPEIQEQQLTPSTNCVLLWHSVRLVSRILDNVCNITHQHTLLRCAASGGWPFSSVGPACESADCRLDTCENLCATTHVIYLYSLTHRSILSKVKQQIT